MMASVAIVLIACLAGALQLYSFYNIKSSSTLSVKGSSEPVTQEVIAIELPEISSQLFGSKLPEIESIEVVETARDYTLIGVLSTPDSGEGAAVVIIDSRSRYFKVNDVIEANVSLAAIEKDHIVIRTIDGKEKLYLKSAQRPALFPAQQGSDDVEEVVDIATKTEPAVFKPKNNREIREAMARILKEGDAG